LERIGSLGRGQEQPGGALGQTVEEKLMVTSPSGTISHQKNEILGGRKVNCRAFQNIRPGSPRGREKTKLRKKTHFRRE